MATRITAVHGSLAAFDSTSEDWTEYIERLQFSFDANGISDAAKYSNPMSCMLEYTNSGAENMGGRGGNRPSTLQGGGAEPLHFLLCLTGYY